MASCVRCARVAQRSRPRPAAATAVRPAPTASFPRRCAAPGGRHRPPPAPPASAAPTYVDPPGACTSPAARRRAPPRCPYLLAGAACCCRLLHALVPACVRGNSVRPSTIEARRVLDSDSPSLVGGSDLPCARAAVRRSLPGVGDSPAQRPSAAATHDSAARSPRQPLKAHMNRTTSQEQGRPRPSPRTPAS